MLKYIAPMLLVALGPSLSPADELPNVILMMADDMGMGDTSAYQDVTGNSDVDQISTPSMQRLARIGVRFTDAHTPSSRCSPTRYGLLTGRYPWRNRLKHYVLFGVQGDPMIERGRPTLGTLMQASGYRTGLFGKWHVGLRYRQSNGRPAAAWDDADLTQPMADTPLDHGFDVCQFTSRSHGTSGLAVGTKKRPNDAGQSTGPGHIDGRSILSATGRGKQLKAKGADAYVLTQLGGRHSDHAMQFLSAHMQGGEHASQPFFVYYPSNSNHSPYTPDEKVGEVAVAGQAKSMGGQRLNTRADFVYENDVALGRMLDFLEEHEDPRRPGHKLLDNTIVVFTSDNGAERPSKISTGPFRSNKGSCFEGGHRVPFIVSWKNGSVGDGDPTTTGQTNPSLICLTDMFATLAEATGQALPDLRAGQIGGEDSQSVLASWRGETLPPRPMFYHDHKESKPDPAASVLRLDHPVVDGQVVDGQWKIFYDASLLRRGQTNPVELYDLATDPREANNRMGDPSLKSLVNYLGGVAKLHRNSGGHRYGSIARLESHLLDFRNDPAVRQLFATGLTNQVSVKAGEITLKLSTLRDGVSRTGDHFHLSHNGLGVEGGEFKKVDQREAIVIQADCDIIIDSVTLIANGDPCGGYYRLGDRAPLAIYCIDADIDSKDQSGILSDMGLLRAGEALTLSSERHVGVETPGSWRLAAIQVRGVQ